MTLIKEWTRDLRYQPYASWSKDYLTELTQTVAQSNWRLDYHIQPETGLLNDPNGFSYFNGQWHVFYQAYPMGPVHGLKSWYHLTSENLVDWQEEGLALVPDNDYDSHGVYSGSAIPVKDRLFLAYTGNVRDEQWNRTAYQMGAWLDKAGEVIKVDTPLISPNPAGYTDHFRDPQLFTYKEQYYMLVGAQNEALEGKILTYKSYDLEDWQLLGELDFTKEDMGFMVECPNLVFADDQPILIFCPQGLDQTVLPYQNIYPNTYVLAENFAPEENQLINPTTLKQLDEGFDVYATQAFNAPDGRALAISWVGLPEIAYPTDQEGWAHCLSMVKELQVVNGELLQKPASEMLDLRENSQTLNGELQSNAQVIAADIRHRYELELDFPENAQGTLTLLADPQTKMGFKLSFDTERGTMTLNRENAGSKFAEEFGFQRSFTIDTTALSLQIFVDASIVEIFINDGKQVATARVFPNDTIGDILLSGNAGSFSGKLWNLRSME